MQQQAGFYLPWHGTPTAAVSVAGAAQPAGETAETTGAAFQTAPAAARPAR